jgi:hypothetical protein
LLRLLASTLLLVELFVTPLGRDVFGVLSLQL